jgi:sulfofructose kinase
MKQVDYLVCSEKFARQFAGDEETALGCLAEFSPAVVITLGEKGLIWRRGQERGAITAFPIAAIDTTGAGDAFHGAFAAAVSLRMNWPDVLNYASAAGALCCTKTGARPGLPSQEEHQALFERRKDGNL